MTDRRKLEELNRVMKMQLADHQKKALGEMHDGCILAGGVGSGKSRVALAYYMITEQHEDVYVITTAKKRDSIDWQTEAARLGIGGERNATLAGVLTVDSWNNLHKYVDVKNAFFIFDEQRVVGYGKWTKNFLKVTRNNRWIMLSATPGDTWMEYIPVFIANGFYRNRTQFKHEHVIYAPFSKYPKIDRYVNVQKLVRHRAAILVRMPYDRETVRHPIIEWVDYDVDLLRRVEQGLWNVYKDEPIRETGEKFHVMRQVVNSHPSRIRRIEQLLDKHPRLIVFYNYNYEREALRNLGLQLSDRSDVAYAEWNGDRHEAIPETERWLYVVQYTAGSEGWNCTETNAIAFYSLTYSYKQWEQAHGRIDRMDTPFIDLYYYILRSKATIDWAIWRSLKSKKSFQYSHYDMENSQFANFVVGK